MNAGETQIFVDKMQGRLVYVGTTADLRPVVAHLWDRVAASKDGDIGPWIGWLREADPATVSAEQAAALDALGPIGARVELAVRMPPKLLKAREPEVRALLDKLGPDLPSELLYPVGSVRSSLGDPPSEVPEFAALIPEDRYAMLVATDAIGRRDGAAVLAAMAGRTDAGAKVIVAWAHVLAGDAAAATRVARDIDPTAAPGGVNDLAWLWLSLDPEEALRLLHAHLDSAKASPAELHTLAVAEAIVGSVANAANHRGRQLDQAGTLAPHWDLVQGAIAGRLGEHAAARRYYDNVIDTEPGDRPDGSAALARRWRDALPR